VHHQRDRAVVLGAGVAGLLTARVLSDHFAEVVVVERDLLPNDPGHRRGATQGRHVHALLARGQRILEARFPGLTSELLAAGARTGDVLAQTRMYFSGHRLHPGVSGLTLVSASRPLLEAQVCRRVRRTDGVKVLDGWEAVEPSTGGDGHSVTGIRVAPRSGGLPGETIEADLVVDATGRNSRAADWLDDLGFGRPREHRVGVDVAYATRRYRMGADALGGDLAVVTAPTPVNPRAGVLGLIEGDVGLLTLAGIVGDRPPLDPDGFTRFAASLALPDIHDAVVEAEPVDDPVPHRFPASTWRRYDRLRRLPRGFAVVGDAVCSLNPIYGQGMTTAALQAEALGRHLARSGHVRSRRFQREVARVLAPVWGMAAGADLQHAGVTGRRTLQGRLLGAYVTRLHSAAAHDPALSNAFAHVASLVRPPQVLLWPDVALRVLRHRTNSDRGRQWEREAA
jgi:2-polyprenyl-6-methoxyphenol hydroxylase-like FAD-dependent oxidoreductase